MQRPADPGSERAVLKYFSSAPNNGLFCIFFYYWGTETLAEYLAREGHTLFSAERRTKFKVLPLIHK